MIAVDMNKMNTHRLKFDIPSLQTDTVALPENINAFMSRFENSHDISSYESYNVKSLDEFNVVKRFAKAFYSAPGHAIVK